MIDNKALDKLMAELNKCLTPEQHLNRQALTGFFYALAITPANIEPVEWLGDIFNGEIPQLAPKQIKLVKKSIIAVVRSSNQSLVAGTLKFPFDFTQLDEGMTPDIWDWAYGFLRGVNLRYGFWTSGIVANDTNQIYDVVRGSINIFTALVAEDVSYLDNLDFLREQLRADGKDPSDDLILAVVLQTLPDAYECIRIYAAKISESLQSRQQQAAPVPNKRLTRSVK